MKFPNYGRDMNLQERFLSDVEKFLIDTGTRVSVLGQESIKDPNLVVDLRNGRASSSRTMDKVYEWMANHVVAP